MFSGRFIESAEAYAATQTSFEEVALKFVTLEKKEALKHFLKIRLDNLRSQVTVFPLTFLWYWFLTAYELRLCTCFLFLRTDFIYILVSDCALFLFTYSFLIAHWFYLHTGFLLCTGYIGFLDYYYTLTLVVYYILDLHTGFLLHTNSICVLDSECVLATFTIRFLIVYWLYLQSKFLLLTSMFRYRCHTEYLCTVFRQIMSTHLTKWYFVSCCHLLNLICLKAVIFS